MEEPAERVSTRNRTRPSEYSPLRRFLLSAGVSASSKAFEASEKLVPSALTPFAQQPKQEAPASRAQRRKLWGAGLIFLGLLGIAVIFMGWSSTPKPAPRLTAIGEGEFREEFVSVEGTQASKDNASRLPETILVKLSGLAAFDISDVSYSASLAVSLHLYCLSI